MTATVLQAKTKYQPLETGLGGDARKELAESLAKVLSDTYVLLVKTHVYHWNVVGPLFLPIHQLTEEHYNDLFKATDEIAERVRALGHVTPVSFTAMESKTKLEEETGKITAEEMIEQLADDHEKMVRRFREITKAAADVDDYVTHDMLNARLAFHEKAIWMLRAMLVS